MAIVGTFHITGSFNLTGRGLIIVGDLTSGKVEVGYFVTFQAGAEVVTLRIGGLGMGRRTSKETDLVGLTFGYKDEDERGRFASFQLTEQDAKISDQSDTE